MTARLERDMGADYRDVCKRLDARSRFVPLIYTVVGGGRFSLTDAAEIGLSPFSKDEIRELYKCE